MNDFVFCSNLEITSHNQIPYQCHIHFTGASITQWFPLGCKAKFYQRNIRLIGKIYPVNALLIIAGTYKYPFRTQHFTTLSG